MFSIVFPQLSRNETPISNTSLYPFSGAMDPRCKVCIFMGKTDRSADRHRQQSMIIVPMDAPGVKIIRALHVFGSQDPPRKNPNVTSIDFVGSYNCYTSSFLTIHSSFCIWNLLNSSDLANKNFFNYKLYEI